MTAPHRSRMMTVEPQWIDYNGHLNMAYYNVLFDRGADDLFSEFGIGPNYPKTRGFSTFSAEFHVCYLRELKEGDAVYVTSQLIDMDEKRFHFYQELHHADGWLSATGEGLGLHIDISGPRVAPMPEDVFSKMQGVLQAHKALPRPERVGRKIGIPRG
ncbi:thioesterase family protein [Aestuariivita boseongensis]|uniref:thioesterase family protein n=1 Tax=Aestuariivita boseongensis TaxID=1470562 RepID=UPI000681DB60|nr:thioesterase family protein [Aestuariivita boseongensis]